MNKFLFDKIQDVLKELDNKKLTEKNVFRISNKLDNILQYIYEEVE